MGRTLTRRGRSGSMSRSRRPRQEWKGAESFIVQSPGLIPVQIIGSQTATATMTSPTLKTIRGSLVFQTILSAVSEGSRYVWGIIVRPVVYATVIPDPIADIDLPWMFWGQGIVQATSLVSSGGRTVERVPVHVKVQRRLNEADEVIFVVNNGGPNALDIKLGLRLLYSEGR